MNRPTFFLSSTIFDFRDLRSALKFYLEEQGCTVLASEYNDFQKTLDQHSYDACLDAIKKADYFILFIGSRIGGWYDKPNRVSITMREYRDAYELHKKGKLKLFCFVRSEVWQAKDDRKTLAKYISSFDLTPELTAQITNHPSKSMEDAELISAFINEVGRNKETQNFISNGTPAPTGNWINVFNNFRDVTEVIRGSLFNSTPVEDLTLRRLLRRELEEFLVQSLVKFGSKNVHSPRRQIDLFHEEHEINLAARDFLTTSVETKRWDLLASLSMQLLTLKLHPIVLSHAVTMPTFLTFDFITDAYKETPVYEALLTLQLEIIKFNSVNLSDVLSVVYENTPRTRRSKPATLKIDTVKLVAFLHLIDRWSNIIDLSKNLIRYLDGHTFENPDLRPKSPIRGMEELLDEETPNADDIRTFLGYS